MTGRERGRSAALAAAGGALLAAATLLAWRGVAPLREWYFHAAWYPTLLLLDGGLALRTGRAPLTGRPRFAASLLFWSAPTWYTFELLNLRMADWYYVFVPASTPVRWVAMFAAFATVLPALYLAYRWMETLELAGGWSRPRFTVGRRHYAACVVLGVAFLALALWRRDAFFPLIWGAATLLLEPFNHARDPRTSLLADLAAGSWTRIVRILAGGAAVGLLWEGFNALAAGRWIYTVPGLEHLKLFEMPLPGFLGFPVFALDAFVIYHALVNAGVAVPGWAPGGPPSERAVGGGARRVRVPAAAALALLCCVAIQVGIDRWTVESVRPRLEDLPGVTPGEVDRIRTAGVRAVGDVAALDTAALAAEAGLPPERAGGAVRAARLVSLRGLGTIDAGALWAAGVRSVCQLARAPEARVEAAVRGVRPRPPGRLPARVRVWLRAARRACPTVPDQP